MTLIKLSTIPLTKLMPKSAPISKFINVKARNPKKVVAALAVIAGNERVIAKDSASAGAATSWLNSANRCMRKVAESNNGARGRTGETAWVTKEHTRVQL